MELMFKLTFLGPALEMHAGGFAWKQGEPRVLDGKVAKQLARTYKYAQWELVEVTESEPKPEPSKRRGRRKTEPESTPATEAEVESESSPLIEPPSVEVTSEEEE